MEKENQNGLRKAEMPGVWRPPKSSKTQSNRCWAQGLRGAADWQNL